uniref:Uncharacterized protein n=1 Tax=Arundo donax TaxID=35708 RepID=A0A0A9HFW0_ARUDO
MQCILKRGSARLFFHCTLDTPIWACCTTGVEILWPRRPCE